MTMYMNGDKPFHHPVTGQLVAPYAWYEGAAHIESEQSATSDEVESDESTGETDDEQDEQVDVPLESMSHSRLKKLAKERGVAGWSTKSPDELVELLKAGE